MHDADRFKRDWFSNPQWWFSKCQEHDLKITNMYGHLLELPFIEVSKLDPLTAIIIFDQLPRHVYRDQYSNHIIEYYLQYAVNIVNLYLDTNYIKQLSSQSWTFCMLPLRHSKEPSKIIYVLNETWKRLETTTCLADIQVYKRFLKASYSRFSIDIKDQHKLIEYQCQHLIVDNAYKDILSFFPSFDEHVNDDFYRSIKFDYELIDISRPILVSLSGGVDSMVCLFTIKRRFPSANISAIHINYDNRLECNKEVLFLKDWCFRRSVPLHIRKISEIHRASCKAYELRDLYESYTRDVRYSTYKTVNKNEGCNLLPQVILGHNKDDSFENIITNINHKNKYNNLSGMTAKSVQDGIEFIRPLLCTTKEDIMLFARSSNIPYLPNSTPVWSQRGQIRNNIVPCLDKWEPQFVPSLFILSNTMSDLYKVLISSVSLFVRNGTQHEQGFVCNINVLELSEVVIFWKEIFNMLFGVYPSCKSLDNLVKSIMKVKLDFPDLNRKEVRKVVVMKGMVFQVQKESSSIASLQICFKP
jgi:tRNA(Ile)-lysidine synthetase-like protein